MVTSLLSIDELRQARALVEASGLHFEPPYQDLVGVFEGDRLVATGARCGRVLKMLAVAPDRQGGDLLAQVVGDLIGEGYREGVDSFFAFTSPANTTTFEALGFKLLAATGQTALLEYGDGLRRYLTRHKELVASGANGAVVANCNPFTLGHRHLIEQAARQVERLYLFLVREERSLFPFDCRQRMVREGIADLPNVVLLDTSCYAVSSVTFPTYFLKDRDPEGSARMELDLILFATRLAPFFGITTRFVGCEPLCPTTARYNEAMRQVLPPLGVAVTEIERSQAASAPISASRVRALLAAGATDLLEALVPQSTLNILLSCEGRRIWQHGMEGA